MNVLVPIALYGWFPLVLLIFREFRGHRAVVISYVTAVLFLPVASFPLYGLPDYGKMSATAMAVMVGTVLFEPVALLRFRPRWFDVPMLVYCFCPIPSAISNELGLMHGISLAMWNVFGWGLPYFIGRIFFRSFEAIRYLAMGIFIGGLIYVPLCLYEIRMSPQLHNIVYGFRPGSWNVVRFGGFRPSVFLDEGLELGLFMMCAALMGYWLSTSNNLPKNLFGIDSRIWLLVLFTTSVLCKCTGATLLLFSGACALMFARSFRSRVPIALLTLLSVVYVIVRSTGLYDGSHVVSISNEVLGPQRAMSLEFRFENEDILVDRALERPILGWGGLGRNRVIDDSGIDISITDGFWIITVGHFGFLGLFAIFGAFLIAPTLSAFRFSRGGWQFQDVAPVMAVSVFLLLFVIDCLLNAMSNAIYPLCLGAVSSVYGMPRRQLEFDNLLDGEFEVLNVGVSRPQRELWPRPNVEQPVLTGSP